MALLKTSCATYDTYNGEHPPEMGKFIPFIRYGLVGAPNSCKAKLRQMPSAIQSRSTYVREALKDRVDAFDVLGNVILKIPMGQTLCRFHWS